MLRPDTRFMVRGRLSYFRPSRSYRLGQPLFSRLVARSVLVTGSPCSLQGLCVAQRHRLGDLLAVRFDDALLACGRLRSSGETLRDRTEACG
jgi:hypothetical protein